MNVAFSVGKALVDENGKYKEDITEYNPKTITAPHIWELADTYDYDKLVDNIVASNLPDKEKAFLILTSARFVQFHYDKIAKYYLFASEEMQALMRESVLIALDKDTADKLGFVKGVIREG